MSLAEVGEDAAQRPPDRQDPGDRHDVKDEHDEQRHDGKQCVIRHRARQQQALRQQRTPQRRRSTANGPRNSQVESHPTAGDAAPGVEPDQRVLLVRLQRDLWKVMAELPNPVNFAAACATLGRSPRH